MRILVTGANGQIGTVLTQHLRKHYGKEAVIASDIKIKPEAGHDPFVILDILNVQRIKEVIHDFKITQIYHLAAILSASGEWNPLKTWNINLNGLLSVLELAYENKLEKVFFPSSIAVFGSTTPRLYTPQHTATLPETVYGISKISGEYWCNYYAKRYHLDVRSLRYPGIISYETLPGGGTTDYAVEIFHEAIKQKNYTCFLKPTTKLPMLYMPDALKATIDLMEAPVQNISQRIGYNLSGMSFTPAQLAQEIKKHIPDFTISYEPDFRQSIADSWSESIDDSKARDDWGWKPVFDLQTMTIDMIKHLHLIYP